MMVGGGEEKRIFVCLFLIKCLAEWRVYTVLLWQHSLLFGAALMVA